MAEDKYNPWIGFDFDGTLAEYHGWKSWDHLGDPIPARCMAVCALLERGYRVKIFTARMHDEQRAHLIEDLIHQWCARYFGQELEVTNVKDYEMVLLVDDRCLEVETNGRDDPNNFLESILHRVERHKEG